jgi:hypothetical protein
MSTMDLDFIDEVLGTTRSKTNSTEYLREFLSSGELGREIDLTLGSFAGKSCKQVKMALDNARKRINEETATLVIPGGLDLQIRVLQETNGKRGAEKVVTSEKVYIINTKLVAEARKSK